MNSKIILFTLIGFTSVSFANFFVGVEGGGNITKDTNVGDLPMAREEFQIANYKTNDLPEYIRIATGKSYKDGINAAAHLNSVELVYKKGFNFSINVGYRMKNILAGIKWVYTKMNYDSINSVGDGQNIPHIFWSYANGSGSTTSNAYLTFVQYSINELEFYKITPLVGFGLGMARVQDKLSINNNTKKRSQNIFAYQFEAGLKFDITKNLSTSLTGVFLGTSEVKATNNKLKQGQLNLGVKWIFN